MCWNEIEFDEKSEFYSKRKTNKQRKKGNIIKEVISIYKINYTCIYIKINWILFDTRNDFNKHNKKIGWKFQ